MAKIVATDKEGTECIRFLLDTGAIVDRGQAYTLATRGEIEGVIPAIRGNDDEGDTYYIRSKNDTHPENNLRSLPSIDQFLSGNGKQSDSYTDSSSDSAGNVATFKNSGEQVQAAGYYGNQFGDNTNKNQGQQANQQQGHKKSNK